VARALLFLEPDRAGSIAVRTDSSL
jgi:hypothetical protein